MRPRRRHPDPILALLCVLFVSLVPIAAAAQEPGDSAATRTPGLDEPMPPPPADFDRQRVVRAGFLIVDGVYNSELMAPYDILHHTPFHTDPDPGIEVFTVSPDGAPVTSFEGLVIEAHHGFADAPPIDILVVPSAEHSMGSDLENEALIAWVRETARSARFVLSLCDGAFVLAEAGLLESRAVTTFPGDQDAFAERYPALDLRRDVSFVHDGPVLTSVGGARSYDPALYLVAHLYGDRVARGVAAGLVLSWPPAWWSELAPTIIR